MKAPPALPAFAALAGIGALVHLAPGVVAWRTARCRVLPGLSGVGRPDHVALTFDDGPDPISTPAILDELERIGWKATFFCLGSQVLRSPGLARELIERGHEVAVHGFTHQSHLLRPAPAVITDLRRAVGAIEEATSVSPVWFRPPYGAVSASSIVAARKVGLSLVLWTTWGVDWKERSTGHSVAEKVERTFVPGATVLLHDSDLTSAPGSWRSTLGALPILHERWERARLRVGPLSEHAVRSRALARVHPHPDSDYGRTIPAATPRGRLA